MDQFIPLLVTSALLTLPLIPATILYLVLTPKRRDTKTGQDDASGEFDTGTLNLWRLKLRFNVIGSTATYVVLLLAAYWIHHDTEQDSQRAVAQRAEALKDQQAWIVEVPVKLRGSDNSMIAANERELQQVLVELEPSLTLASSNAVQFWVVPNNGKFPTVRFSLSTLSRKAETLDLNDVRLIQHDYTKRKMEGISPVWLEIGERYDPGKGARK